MWNIFQLKDGWDLHDLYMETDFFLLADLFETFRDWSLENNTLDPTHFTTAPGLSWAAYLKHTKVKLEIPLDPNMNFSLTRLVSNYYTHANNPKVEGYDLHHPQTYWIL